jgi:hypothetical protein
LKISYEEFASIQNVKQDLQEDEFIEVMLVPLDSLFDTLQNYSSNAQIDAKLYTFAYALKHFKTL